MNTAFPRWQAACGLASALTLLASVQAIAVEKTTLTQWTTTRAQKLKQSEPLQWTQATTVSPDKHKAKRVLQISIDENHKAQTILGFGAALTESSCYLINRLPEPARQNLIDELFNPEKMGMSTVRIAVGASDYAVSPYSFDDGEVDPELARFSISHDEENILPVLKSARNSYPDLFIFGSPWSPPGWMKPNKSMLGGSMPRRNLGVYANYITKFLRSYEAAGVPVQAVTVNNEVDTDQDGRMPACVWPQEIEMDFVAGHLGPKLQEEKINTKIWILDHNYNMWGRVLNELESPDVLKYTNGVAWHPYAGSPNAMTKVHKAHPKLGMHWTEDGPDVDEPGYATNWASWGAKFTEALRNWCSSITDWNLALDEEGKPNIGPFKCGGTITINSKTQAITYSGQYWGTVHFSKFIRPGARIIVTAASHPTEIAHIAAHNPDDTYSVVLTNPRQSAQTLALNWRNKECQIQLPPDSISTISW
ncbi:MAG: hypothetical protein K2X77_04290 [Candidatus Obscuribacterales bacterium]|jgi:glucosylceramidase|nr:hypothetical protein [Candidatus Obscuribacterales bacterium]